MSTTRALIDNLTKNDIRLTEVKPTNTLLLGPQPCENQAATITNRTVKSMREDKLADVAFRYVQASEGEANTRFKVVIYGMLALLLYWTLAKST